MKNMKWSVTNVRNAARVMVGAFTFSVALFLFSFESLAAEGTVKPASAKIRSEANTSSEALASVEAGDELTIKAKTTGADGYVWYQVFVDANTLGFIRSDLVEADGTVPEMKAASSQTTSNSESNSQSASQTESPAPQTVTITVEPMESQSATITGGDVNVRASASTSTAKVAQAKNGTAITVTGQATGADGKVWYQVTFINDGTEVTGFIRSDYVELGAVIEQTPAPEEAETPETEVPEEPVQTANKTYDTVLETKEDGTQEWYLYDYSSGYKYSIPDLMAVTQNNSEADGVLETQIKQQKIIIIVLIVLIVILILGVTLLFFKMHEGDSFDEDDEEEEEIPVRRRKTEKPMERPVREPVRRPAQTADRAQRRPVQEGNTRPRQAAKPVRQTEQAAPRPVQRNVQRPAQKPVQKAVQSQEMPYKMPEKEVTFEEEPKLDTGKNANNQWHSKNFLADDDEFEFEFLNMDDPNRL